MDDSFPPGLTACWEQFLTSESSRQSGLDLYHELFETSLGFPLQRAGELSAMMRLAREIQPKVIMEIGADRGGGLYHWVKCQPTVKRAIACEIRGCPYREPFAKAFPQVEFLWLAGSSRNPEMIGRTQNWLRGDPIDCLFLDGDKSYFREDFDAYLPLMNPRGLVFMHDITDRTPGQAFWSLEGQYALDKVVDLTDYRLAHKRELAGIPPANPHEAWLRHWRGSSCGLGIIDLSKRK